MKTLTYLQNLANKNSGDTLSASDWNAMVQAVLNGATYNNASADTFTIEMLDSNGDWKACSYTEGVEITLTVGNTYRVSGYIKNTPIKMTSTTGATTTIILNGVVMESNTGYNIQYAPEDEKKTLIVKVNPGTENFLVQTSALAAYESYGCLYSKNNMEVQGTGYLALINAVGHGMRSSELNITGDIKVYADTKHDALHGTKLVDIHWGQYYIDKAKDAIGTGLQDTADAGKLRGIIRVFGGKFYINSLTDHTVFDAKYTCMKCEIPDGGSEYYTAVSESDTSTLSAEDFSSLYYIHSGIFSSKDVSVECFNTSDELFPTTTFANVNYYREYLSRGTASVDDNGTAVTLTDGKYTCSSTNITVSGYITNPIIVTAKKAEVHLQRAYIEVADEAGAIQYTATAKSMQIDPTKNTEGNYIAGTIYSAYNIKFTPKASSNLYLRDSAKATVCRKLTIGNGGGYMYVTNNTIGLNGGYFYLGTDDDYDPASDTSGSKKFTGALYAFNNGKKSLNTYLTSNYTEGTGGATGDINGTITVTTYDEGTFYVDYIYLDKSMGTEVASVNSISTVSVGSTGVLKDNPGKLYYQHLKGFSQGATKYLTHSSGVLNNYFTNECLD